MIHFTEGLAHSKTPINISYHCYCKNILFLPLTHVYLLKQLPPYLPEVNTSYIVNYPTLLHIRKHSIHINQSIWLAKGSATLNETQQGHEIFSLQTLLT